MKKNIINIISALLVLCLAIPSVGFAAPTIEVNVDIVGNSLNISGNGCGSTTGAVVIKVVDPSGALFNLNQIQANPDGTFAYSLTLGDSAQTGNYVVIATERGRSDSETEYYLNPAKVTEIENTVDLATDAAALAAYLEDDDNSGTIATALEINTFTATDYFLAAQMLINAAENDSIDFNAIKSIAKRAPTLFQALNETSDTSFETFISGVDNSIKRSSVLLGACDEYQDYLSFANNDRETVGSLVLAEKPYVDGTLNYNVDVFKTKFKDAVLSVKSTIAVRKISAETEVVGDVISIEGVSGLSYIRAVTIKVIDPDSNIINLNQIKTEKDGSYSYSITMPENAVRGDYTIEVFGRGANEKTICTEFFLSKNERDTIKSAVNGAADKAAMVSVLQTYAQQMQMTTMTQSERENAALYLYEQKTNPYTYEEILSNITKALTLMTNLNLQDWTELDSFIKTNRTTLLDSECRYSSYSSLGDALRGEICSEIMKSAPFTTIDTFRSTFKTELNEKLGSDSGSGGSGSGSGFGGGSGSGGGNFGDGFTADYTPDASGSPSDLKAPFNDLAAYSWAEESIALLYNKGVISFSYDHKYRPADDVSREEFVKLVVCAFGIQVDATESSFTDVDAQAWYAPYITAAANKGIINGMPDGSFGIGKRISRQDMAVIIERCANVQGITLPSIKEAKVFHDESEIAIYARNAVNTLVKSGIINGDENGNFRPADNATRAEAAKMLAVLVKIALK